MQHVLAGVERRPVDEPPVVSLEDLPVAVQLADVEAVAENVRERRAVERGLALAVDVPFAFEFVGRAILNVWPPVAYSSKMRTSVRDFSGCGWTGSSRSSTLM